MRRSARNMIRHNYNCLNEDGFDSDQGLAMSCTTIDTSGIEELQSSDGNEKSQSVEKERYMVFDRILGFFH